MPSAVDLLSLTLDGSCDLKDEAALRTVYRTGPGATSLSKVADHLHPPDRRGNQRIDSLRNIARDPRVALLFLIPGVGETLRVNGRARISALPALCDAFMVDGKAPASVPGCGHAACRANEAASEHAAAHQSACRQ